MYKDTFFFKISLSLKGPLACFHLMTVVSNAAMNVCANTSLRPTFQFFGVYTQKWNW